MNNWLKYGLFFTGGLALGALGAVAVSRGQVNLRPFMRDLVAGGMEVRDRAAALIGGAKEHLEDIVAEATEAHETKKQAKAQAVQSADQA